MDDLKLKLDKHYPFEVSFYHETENDGIYCLIIRPDEHFILLQKISGTTLWTKVNSSKLKAEFEAAIMTLAPLLLRWMITTKEIKPLNYLSSSYLPNNFN
ncbi:hypothetical protein FPZ42_11465 [Mucilaginibacter achroorhodeus]|uniref:Uncharacterized protein n=1 Tax=Mucilaginibacter achroorhodeus TaxID=2599294 RepID=A0A563U4F7_9SPHI|nr:MULTISPECIES: hypothetical protein [Mucilaginibacter]QXV64275.1 hypothetical protein INP83_14405 [Mucilaginibacter sp. 21P]TWR26236.1 hypothetical protein FPZ42_11465 [Mucilaginibacter achroorhodeus]